MKGNNMKGSFGRVVSCAAVVAMLNLGALASRAAEPGLTPLASATAPRIVGARSGFTAADVAKYQLKSVHSQAIAHDKAAGASDKKTALIVVGVLVVVGVVALAAGGGGGGGGGGY